MLYITPAGGGVEQDDGDVAGGSGETLVFFSKT